VFIWRLAVARRFFSDSEFAHSVQSGWALGSAWRSSGGFCRSVCELTALLAQSLNFGLEFGRVLQQFVSLSPVLSSRGLLASQP
jgi:hypothetical protein